MGTTIEDVARVAGVSRGTVSRVLNGAPNVSDSARAAVHRAVAQTGYRLNSHARALASGRNHAVAVLLTQPSDELFDDPTFRELVKGVSEGFGDSSDALLLLLAGSDLERRRTAPFLDRRRLDGVVHLTPHMTDPLLDRIIAAELPVAVCGRLPAHLLGPKVRTVTVDDQSGAAAAVEHLLAAGARRIAIIAGPEDAPGGQLRLEGARLALGAHYDATLVRHGDYGPSSGVAAMEDLLERQPGIDAVFCASDRMAAGAYRAIAARGLRIPDDVQVVGFDDHQIARELTPTLTTVHQPIQHLGQQAIQMLQSLIAGEDPGHRMFPTRLVVRDSTRPVSD